MLSWKPPELPETWISVSHSTFPCMFSYISCMFVHVPTCVLYFSYAVLYLSYVFPLFLLHASYMFLYCSYFCLLMSYCLSHMLPISCYIFLYFLHASYMFSICPGAFLEASGPVKLVVCIIWLGSFETTVESNQITMIKLRFQGSRSWVKNFKTSFRHMLAVFLIHRPFRLVVYAVWHWDSRCALKNSQILQPDQQKIDVDINENVEEKHVYAHSEIVTCSVVHFFGRMILNRQHEVFCRRYWGRILSAIIQELFKPTRVPKSVAEP